MAISVGDIKEGKCYVTPGSQVRRVLEIKTDKVTYEARGKKAIRRGYQWNPKQTVSAEKFATDVDKEVNSWDPDYRQQKPR
jgi:hypothetical protein